MRLASGLARLALPTHDGYNGCPPRPKCLPCPLLLQSRRTPFLFDHGRVSNPRLISHERALPLRRIEPRRIPIGNPILLGCQYHPAPLIIPSETRWGAPFKQQGCRRIHNRRLDFQHQNPAWRVLWWPTKKKYRLCPRFQKPSSPLKAKSIN